MKLKLTFASFLLAITSSAFAVQGSIAGKVGSVTFALTQTTYKGGYKDSNGNATDSKVVTDTATAYKELYKYVTVKTKYSNKEFIADLITKGTLTGAAADWSLKAVESDDFSGLFALNKNGTTVVYLGGDDSGYAFGTSFNGGYAYTESDTYSVTRIDGVDQKSTYIGSYSETDCVTLTLAPLSNVTFTSYAFNSYKESYKSEYDELNDAYLSDTYSVAASSFDSVVGYGGSETLLSGSIKISALKDTADVTIYKTAYDSAHL
jgi:hypothetical protein